MAVTWSPAIYEHKAALIGRTPAEVALSAELLVKAVLAEREIYNSDYLTIGLDVYNIEAESLGAELVVMNDNECPDLAGTIFDLNNLPVPFPMPPIPSSGRFQMLLDAGKSVCAHTNGRSKVRVAASGPISMAAKLTGPENLVISLGMEDGNALKLLDSATTIGEEWCACIRRNGLDAIVFDSMAAPPILSPAMYENVALPLHQRLMERLRDMGQDERELVIGGDTTAIATCLKSTGATTLVCDYPADAKSFRKALGDDSNFRVRRNINPTLLSTRNLKELADDYMNDLTIFTNPIAGTGILPFNFNPDNLLGFQSIVNIASGRDLS